jgi:hypothetical protein
MNSAASKLLLGAGALAFVAGIVYTFITYFITDSFDWVYAALALAAFVILTLLGAAGSALTTGSMFLFGAAAYAGIVGAIYATSNEFEYVGTLVFGGLFLAAGFLGFVVVAFRDADLAAPALAAGSPADAEGTLGFRQPIVTPSLWPIAAAFGVGLTLIGLVTDWRWFVGGLLVIAAAAIEWAVQAWADRASDDPRYNAAVRKRVMGPIEFPVAGAALVGLVIFAFSRVMLAVEKEAAIVAFIGLGVLLLAVFVVLAARKQSGITTLSIIAVLGAVALLTAGVIAAAEGERTFEHGGGGGDGGEEQPIEDSTNEVGDKASVFATITFDDGEMTPDQLTIPRSLPVDLLFDNEDEGDRRLVVEAGTRTSTDEAGQEAEEEVIYTTREIGEGQSGFLTLTLGKSGTYAYYVEGEEGRSNEGVISVP